MKDWPYIDLSFENAKRSIYYTKSLLQNLYYKNSGHLEAHCGLV